MKVYVTSGVNVPSFHDDPSVDDALSVGAVYSTPEAAMRAIEQDVRDEIDAYNTDKDPDEESMEYPEKFEWKLTKSKERYWELTCGDDISAVHERVVR